ncbi:ABC transporter substrate-binding protein [Nocardia aurantia]|uniref:ABC transporter substrate-binding protein n=1 Tax=Nocardia aurantia TaxID=2585199 RepID=A0A7K0DXW7_9NOCA|nr:ABC transporter substrate-binding protein [Nocardia aurantia]MQY30387.1 hypothetical protein [Nocardia aurantia]
MVARRTILRAGVLAPILAGCAPGVLGTGATAIRVAVPWSGDELRAFRKVLAGLPRAAPGDAVIEVVPLGDEIDTALSARGHSAPEIVMLPTVGEVRSSPPGRLKPAPAGLWSTDGKNHGEDDKRLNYGKAWRKLLWPRGEPYAVPFKAAAKSLVWYDRTAFPGDPDAPRHWTVSDWPAHAVPGRALLALGAADGWVLADMFENILHSRSPYEYQVLQDASWAGEQRNWNIVPIYDAFVQLGSLWGAPGVFPGGVGRALTSQFPDAVRAVFEHRLAAMVAAPDFAAPIVRSAIERAHRSDDEVGVTWFPASAPGMDAPRLGGGDVMVMTEKAGPAAEDLVRRLAVPQAAASWVQNPGGFLVPRRDTEPLPDWKVLKDIAAHLNEWAAFGLADVMGAAGRRNGLWHVLTDLLKAVGTGSHPEKAAQQAVDGMIAAEKRLR